MNLSERLSRYDRVIAIKTKIGLVPLYKFIEKFLYIENEEGRRIKFILNSDQVDLYESMCKQKIKGEPIRIDILKARQKGFSTFIAGVIFVMTIFQPGMKSAIIADIAEHASNLFKKYQFFYDNLPNELKSELEKEASNAKELIIRHRNGQLSSIRIMVQGDSAGRSGTYQYLHLSECAFWANLHDTLVSLLQTVSSTNKESMVFLETTANGVNDYKLKWDKDYSGESKYQAKFYAWYTTERYRVEEKELRDFVKPDWLRRYEEDYKLDKEQVQWYWDKYNEFDDDLEKLRQEFPNNPVEAFVTSGNSVFNTELLSKRKTELLYQKPLKKGMFSYKLNFSLDGKRIDMVERKWVESKSGSIKIYIEPEIGHPYVVSNDPASGGEDFFATQVFDNYTGKQVAVYHKNRCDADDAAYQMYCLAVYYNNALVTGETNTTSYLLEVCRKLGYRFIYQDQDVEDLGMRYMNKLGYKTKQNNRTYMIDLFKIAFRDDPSIINDYETICEMEMFQVIKHASGKEKAEATGGSHDDLVMSCCGFYLCRGAQSSVPRIESGKEKGYKFDPFEIYKERTKQERDVYQIWD